MTPLHALIYLSRKIGRDPFLVQAGGGNISIKENSHHMVIKASGIRLKDVDRSRGWARSEFRALAHQLPQLYRKTSVTARELGYADLLGRSGRTSGWRVSMEAGFHAIIPAACIIHMHSIAGILLGLMPRPEAAHLVRDILGVGVKLHSIPPSIPGLDLTHRVAKQLQESTSAGGVGLWILQNHGIIWTAEKPTDILRASGRLESSLRDRFKMSSYPFPHRPGSASCKRRRTKCPAASATSHWRELCMCTWPSCSFDLKPLFPDFTIYFDIWGLSPPDLIKTSDRSVQIRSENLSQFQNQKEVFFAHALVSVIAHKRRWGKALPLKMVRAIKGLETERLRLAQAAHA